MRQYLLAVHMVAGEPARSDAEMQQAYQAGRRLQRRAPVSRRLGVRRRPPPAGDRHRRRAQGGQVVTTDGPFAETKEQLGGFWIVEVPDLDAALDLGRQGVGRLRRPGRGPAVPGRARSRVRSCRAPTRAAIERVFREESGRVVATLVRLFGDIDLAEEAVQEAFAVASERWPATGLPPNPGGWITTTARNRAIDRLRRECLTPRPPRPGRRCCTSRRRAIGGGTGARRPPPPDLHLLPPGARPRAPRSR